MAKLNKNQTKFFEEAIKYFKEDAKDVRYKDLVTFAEKNELIIPISALKLFCQREELIRGHYDLTLSGITIEIPEDNTPIIKNITFINDCGDGDDGRAGGIIESSVFAEKPIPEKQKKVFTGMVFVVLDSDLLPLSAHRTPQGAYNTVADVFDNSGVISFSEVEKKLKTAVGIAEIFSGSSESYFIHALELKN